MSHVFSEENEKCDVSHEENEKKCLVFFEENE